ncbi:uncharacterized protein [Leptinotarsa decemlineata]|uniref:uncharacterized protein n=1 Tax=Leptinotarsa decemlineata TaxID=7539 RepID=UPI003D30D6C2
MRIIMCKPVTYCVLSALLVASIAAYNFDDPDFNQFLADDLEDVYSSSYTSPRQRRDEKAVEDDKCHPSRRGRPRVCCAEEAMNSIHEEKRDIKRACFKDITGKEKPQRQEKRHGPRENLFDPFNCEKVEQHRRDMICIQQCVGQKLNFIDTDGNVKPEDFEKYIKKVLEKKDYLLPLQEKIISTCLEEVKNSTQKAAPEDSCTVTAIKLDHCIFKNIQLNCPEDKIKDSKSCSRLQERLKADNFVKGPPPSAPTDFEDE